MSGLFLIQMTDIMFLNLNVKLIYTNALATMIHRKY